MKKLFSSFFAATVAASVICSPSLAFAEGTTPVTPPPAGAPATTGTGTNAATGYNAGTACPAGATCLTDTLKEGPSDLVAFMKRMTNWLFTFLLLLAVMFFIIAGYKYLTSGGGEEVGSAHKMVIYGAVAVAVGTLAQGIMTVVQKLVSTT